MSEWKDAPEEWKRILRRATLYTWGFLAAAVVVAVGGSALVALLLASSGLPFVRTWLVLIALVALGAAAGLWYEKGKQ